MHSGNQSRRGRPRTSECGDLTPLGSIAFLIGQRAGPNGCPPRVKSRASPSREVEDGIGNLLGSMAFGVSAVAAYVVPSGSVWNAEVASNSRHACRCGVLSDRRDPAAGAEQGSCPPIPWVNRSAVTSARLPRQSKVPSSDDRCLAREDGGPVVLHTRPGPCGKHARGDDHGFG